jgi:hypothetical protein
MTISDSPGTGAGRFLDVTDDQGTWRIKVTADPNCSVIGPPMDGGMSGGDMGQMKPSDGGTPICTQPGAPTGLKLVPHGSSMDVSFASSNAGAPTARFDLRYSYGQLTDANFTSSGIASAAPPPGSPGATVETMLTGLKPTTDYYVAVRALASCGAASPIAVAKATTTKATFVTLHGCFIATAAYGTPLAKEIDVLRRFRDRRLLDNPLGQLAVAAYYSLSPPVAAAITSDERLRHAARALVEPVVRVTRAAEVAGAHAVP